VAAARALLSDRREMISAMAIADQIVEVWAALAADTSALRDSPPLDQPGGRDWAALLLVERFRVGIGAAVVGILQQSLPLTVAGLCVRDVLTAGNAAYAPAAGEQFDVAAAVTEELPYLRERIERAIERAVARG
jgi:hypothetical protein